MLSHLRRDAFPIGTGDRLCASVFVIAVLRELDPGKRGSWHCVSGPDTDAQSLQSGGRTSLSVAQRRGINVSENRHADNGGETGAPQMQSGQETQRTYFGKLILSLQRNLKSITDQSCQEQEEKKSGGPLIIG